MSTILSRILSVCERCGSDCFRGDRVELSPQGAVVGCCVCSVQCAEEVRRPRARAPRRCAHCERPAEVFAYRFFSDEPAADYCMVCLREGQALLADAYPAAFAVA